MAFTQALAFASLAVATNCAPTPDVERSTATGIVDHHVLRPGRVRDWKSAASPSRSRKGDSHDNAVAESFFSTLEFELPMRDN